jgi:protein required for attachment to host cells
MILPHDTVVAVADGANLKLFRNKGTESHLDLVELYHPNVAPTNPGSGSRHRSNSFNPDVHRKEEDSFAAASAEQLNHLLLDGSLERLLVIADPRTLGELRKHFHSAVRAKIIGELAKELTDHSVHDLVAAIRHA